MAVNEGSERTALYVDDAVLSYRELDLRVRSASSRLQQLSNGPVVGVSTSNPWLTLLSLHAAARLGLALLPLDLQMPRFQREALLSQTGCRLVICDEWKAQLPRDVKRVRGEELLRLAEGPVKPEHLTAAAAMDPQPIGLIVPTSGSTSDPKGVMLSAANLAASARQVNRQLGLNAGDCWLNCLPLSHVAGLSIPYRCSQAGAAMLLHRGFDAARVWQDLERYPISHISLVPAMLGRLLDAAPGRMAPSSLRVALVGGGPLDRSLAERAHVAGWPLAVCYGMSETGSMCVLDTTAQAGLNPGRVGRVMPGFKLVLSEGEQGEIRLAGDAVMVGYANPRLKPGDGLENGWFTTGDLGFWDDRGQLCLSGRADELMNSGGLRLHPREVEQQLEACPGLHTVAVGSRPDPLWGDRLVAFYEGPVSEVQLEAWARAHLPSGLRPREFRSIDRLPRNRMGKLDRRALKRHIQSAPHAMPGVAPWAASPRDSR
ncbi:MAG: AMP-binding protein [Pseudomonadota bacterium]